MVMFVPTDQATAELSSHRGSVEREERLGGVRRNRDVTVWITNEPRRRARTKGAELLKAQHFNHYYDLLPQTDLSKTCAAKGHGMARPITGTETGPQHRQSSLSAMPSCNQTTRFLEAYDAHAGRGEVDLRTAMISTKTRPAVTERTRRVTFGACFIFDRRSGWTGKHHSHRTTCGAWPRRMCARSAVNTA